MTDPLPSKITSCEDCRSPEKLVAIVNGFEVEKALRYQPRAGKTYCNIFVTDVTRALGCEIPHWWRGAEMTANMTSKWLERFGQTYGWQETMRDAACKAARSGWPAVATWYNPGGHGHIAVILPSTPPDVRIAQAGRVNFSNGTLASGFGAHTPRYYLHA